jgi:molecular chaperone GrpE (heat shock protein)
VHFCAEMASICGLVQRFLKSMLDVGDNLERAYTAVPEEALQVGIGFRVRLYLMEV